MQAHLQQQALRGVGVATVTRIHHVHMGCNVLGNQVRRTTFAVANHKRNLLATLRSNGKKLNF